MKRRVQTKVQKQKGKGKGKPTVFPICYRPSSM